MKTTLFIINLMRTCNLNCTECPLKGWVYPEGTLVDPNGPINVLTNDILLKWLDKHCDPKTWVLELTGGEPSLYPEISTLIPELSKRGFHGLIKTNGTLDTIPKSDNFVRLAGWHAPMNIRRPPVCYDGIIITADPNDDWREKKAWCEKRDIAYYLLEHRYFSDSRKVGKTQITKSTNIVKECDGKNIDNIELISFLDSSGFMKYCPTTESDVANYRGNEIDICVVENQPVRSTICEHCEPAIRFEWMFPDRFKEKLGWK